MSTYARADDERSTVVVSMDGEIDVARETELLDKLQVLEPPAGATIAVDISRVSFVDSSGLRGIARAHAYLKNRHCQLQLFNPSDQVLKLITMLGLTNALPLGNRTDSDATLTPAENDGEASLPG
jgi:anti-anti-sigma factor